MILKLKFTLIYLALVTITISNLSAQATPSIQQMMDSLTESALTEKRLLLAENLLKLSKEKDNIQGQFFALKYIGDYYNLKNDYKNAIIYNQQLFDLAEVNNDINTKANAYLGLGNTYNYLGNYELANIYYAQALKLTDKNKNPENYSAIMNGLGMINDELGRYEEAINYYKTSKEYDKQYTTSKKNSEENLWISNNNIGDSYLSLGKYDTALYYFENNLTVSKKNQDSLDFSLVYNNIGNVYLKKKLYKKAFAYYDTAQYYSKLLNQKGDLLSLFQDIAELYDSSNNIDKAIKYYQKADSLESEINSEKLNKQIVELTTKFDNTRLENEEIKEKIKENKILLARQKMWITVISLSAGLLITLLFLRKNKQDAKKKLRLHKLNEDLIKNQLMVKELEAKEFENNLRIKELETIKLEVQLENKKADITNLAIDIVRKNDFSQQLISRLESLEKTKTENIKPKLRETIIFSTTHLQINEDLALLQTNIDEINQAFFQKLDKQFKNLSSNDKYILGLIRLGLSNKEIASIKGISPNSAKVLRYRLRKKLFLIPEVDFTTFLQKF